MPPYQGGLSYFRLGRLPETLERLAQAGWRDFYEGEIAAAIAADVQADGRRAVGRRSARVQGARAAGGGSSWRGRTLQLTGPLTAAPTAADVLRQMAMCASAATPDAAWYVALARALKAAYAQRLSVVGRCRTAGGGKLHHAHHGCDADGTMVAMTTTLLSSMGSRVVLPADRHADEQRRDVVRSRARASRTRSAPGKRPLTNMFPVILRDGAQPWIAAGASGGRRIMASVLQLMSFVADFGMTPGAPPRTSRASTCPTPTR